MKLSSILIAILFTAVSLPAQPREGKHKELSLSGSYQNYSSDDGYSSRELFLISPRLGFFLVEGLEFEPEAIVMFTSGYDPVYALNGNFSYNFISQANGVPFLLLGYGVANNVPLVIAPSRTAYSVDILNAGGGLKIFVKEDIAFRFEYRYQHFWGQRDYTVYGYGTLTDKTDATLHTVQFGFSILL
jgi:hypothetical protein